MADRVFLTEKRKQVLNGEYEGSEEALRNQKSRLRRSASTAFEELIEIAESGEVDTTKIFDDEAVFLFMQALLTPDPNHIEESGLFGGNVDDDVPDDTVAELSDDFEAYRDRIQVQMAKLVLDDPDDK